MKILKQMKMPSLKGFNILKTLQNVRYWGQVVQAALDTLEFGLDRFSKINKPGHVNSTENQQ
ncbi:hypothetical protein KJK34_04665 [Flavobacterium sp. D11R37]|uniref:hypothetical protein n=1 Tax=Flavobacterium coralii TaxID=2838017 RepID=UPI001CA78978|nr:hypothetical protein [Flavobacterium coralii]MBY8962039.1 hypothetical protein [Flavobacterium coralii]